MRISDWSSDVCSSDLRCTHQEIPEDVVFPADPDRRAVGVIGDELGRPVGVQSPGRSLGRADQFKPTRVREYQRTGQAELASGYDDAAPAEGGRRGQRGTESGQVEDGRAA